MRRLSKPVTKRGSAFTIYPGAEVLSELEGIAAAEERKRAPMAVLLLKKGIAAYRLTSPPKPKSK